MHSVTGDEIDCDTSITPIIDIMSSKLDNLLVDGCSGVSRACRIQSHCNTSAVQTHTARPHLSPSHEHRGIGIMARHNDPHAECAQLETTVRCKAAVKAGN
jgi:hypothetical protein